MVYAQGLIGEQGQQGTNNEDIDSFKRNRDLNSE
jgi:hypothetical protein